MEGLDEFFKRSAQAWRHECAAQDYAMTSEALGKAALKYKAGASEALVGLGVATGAHDGAGRPAEPTLGRRGSSPADEI